MEVELGVEGENLQKIAMRFAWRWAGTAIANSSPMNRPGFNYSVVGMDDEPAVRQLSCCVFEDRGFEVRTASDGLEALVELCRSMYSDCQNAGCPAAFSSYF